MSIERRLKRLEDRSTTTAYEPPLYTRVFLKRLGGEPLTDEELAWEREADRRLLEEYIPYLLRTEVSEESRQQARQLEAHVRDKLEKGT